MELKCKSFYALTECAEKARLSNVIFSDNQRMFILYDCLKKINEQLCEKEFEAAYCIALDLSYDAVDFEYPFLAASYRTADLYNLNKYIVWFKERFMDYDLKPASKVSVQLMNPISIEQTVVEVLTSYPAIYATKGSDEYVIFSELSLRGFSQKGKKITTNINTMLDIAVASTEYPTAKFLYVSIKDLCEKGVLEAEPTMSVNDIVRQIISSSECSKNCGMCRYSAVCQSLTLSPTYIEHVTKSEGIKAVYRLPQFDEFQDEAIHALGKVTVFAGPGSGKTATIIGRVNYLVNELQVPPENILLLSFTNKAVEELKERLANILPDGRECFVATINSLASYILSDNKNKIDFGLEVLTDVEKQRMLYNLSKSYPMLQGFNYNLIFGRNGFVDMLTKRVEEYLSYYQNCPGIFADKYEVDTNFFELAHEYESICRHLGYITFDEQVIRAIEFLDAYPDIRNLYHRLWSYVIVDEYQDISGEQHQLIGMLSDSHFVDDLNLYYIINCLNHNMAISLINVEGTLIDYVYQQAGVSSSKSVFDYAFFDALGENDINFYAEVLCFISSSMHDLDSKNIKTFLSELSEVLNMSNSTVLEVMNEILDNNQLSNVSDAFDYLTTMRLFNDSTAYETSESVDALNLLTIHESKGKEFKAVIIYDSENILAEKDKNVISSKNLGYVGMTRAKSHLYILNGVNTEKNRFLRELVGKGA